MCSRNLNGSFQKIKLGFHHSGPRERLDWNIRFKVAVGTAEGIQYLHEGCQRRIIHRDIKAANILLSEDFEAQVSKVMFYLCLTYLAPTS